MLRPIYVCALAGLLAGCAGPSAQLQRDNDRLESEVAELSAETRVQRRTIRDLENQLALLRDRAREARAPADVPDLPIEVRRPDAERSRGQQEFAASGSGSRPADPPDDPPDEPPDEPDDEYPDDEYDDDEVIVLTNIGSRDRAAQARRASTRSRPRAQRKPPRDTAPVPASTDRLPEMDGEVPVVPSEPQKRRERTPVKRSDPKADYGRYLEALRAGNHAFAIAGFRNFVAEFAKHDLADNAQYWLGEAFYDQDEFDAALAEFRKVVANHPGGNKVADAMLKIGYCHIELGDEDAARRVLRRVVQRYSDTDPARLAADRLKSLGDTRSP